MILEYFEDLDYYYNVGYGAPRRLLENLQCPIMQDMIDFLSNDSPSGESVRVYNTHSGVFQVFLVALGVFGNDVPLTAANFNAQQARQWRSSFLTPMATNMAVVRYESVEI